MATPTPTCTPLPSRPVRSGVRPTRSASSATDSRTATSKHGDPLAGSPFRYLTLDRVGSDRGDGAVIARAVLYCGLGDWKTRMPASGVSRFGVLCGIALPGAALLAFATPTFAQNTWGGSLAATTDYIYRGLSQTGGAPAMQGGL